MIWNQIKGGWQQMAGHVRGNWNQLTEEELTTIELRRDQLIGFLQECYGYKKEEAERELDRFTQGRTSHAASATTVEITSLTRSNPSPLFDRGATYIGFSDCATESQLI